MPDLCSEFWYHVHASQAGESWVKMGTHHGPLPSSLNANRITKEPYLQYQKVRKALQKRQYCTYRPKQSPRFIFFGFIWSENRIRKTASRNEGKPIKEDTHTFSIFSRELPQLFRLRDDKLLEASILDKIRVIARYFTSIPGNFGATASCLVMILKNNGKSSNLPIRESLEASVFLKSFDFEAFAICKGF